MLSRRSALILHWTCTLALLLLFALSPRGCTSSKIEATSDMAGNPSVQLTPEQGLTEKSKLSMSSRYATPEFYAQGFTKSDWLFVAFYKYNMRADLSLAPSVEGNRIALTISMPGQITSANADRIDGGRATWSLKLGKKYKMDVASRRIRWAIIAVAALLAVFWTYSRLSLRPQKETKTEKISKTQSDL